jgi:hypothetical protein
MLAVILLWEFVEFERLKLVSDLSHTINSHAFIDLSTAFFVVSRWHAVCTTAVQQNKIGFPGWPEPNLDWSSGFGGSVQKRGLAPAPFFIFLGG